MLTTANTTQKTPAASGVFFKKALTEILGKDYDLSLVFIGDKKMQNLNKHHRGIDKVTDILSFEIDKQNGEIFINLAYAEKKAPKFDMNPATYLKFLFVHGLLHLKGMEHGSRMESEEKKYATLYLRRN